MSFPTALVQEDRSRTRDLGVHTCDSDPACKHEAFWKSLTSCGLLSAESFFVLQWQCEPLGVMSVIEMSHVSICDYVPLKQMRKEQRMVEKESWLIKREKDDYIQ